MLYNRDIFEHDGERFRVTFPDDNDHEAPWEWDCGHGPVSDWTTRDKRPGELLLCSDRHSKRFYDFSEACRIALRDSWNAKPLEVPGETPRQRAAKAARADFEYLRRWCNDQWSYVGVVVELVDDEDEPLKEYSASVWGIESDCHEYLKETAHELADEIIAQYEGFIS